VTKLVKTETGIERADDFSQKLSEAIDEGLAKREPREVAIDIETSPWDTKERYDARRQAAKVLSFGENAGMGPEGLRTLTERMEAVFPEIKKYRETLDLMVRNGVTVDQARVDAIAQRLDGDFSKMSREIVRQWTGVFGSELSIEARSLFAKNAVAHAKNLGVPPEAETTVSSCGCIWALQTTFNSGSGDIILRLCAEHSPKRKQ
jgi:hypothetical protein